MSLRGGRDRQAGRDLPRGQPSASPSNDSILPFPKCRNATLRKDIMRRTVAPAVGVLGLCAVIAVTGCQSPCPDASADGGGTITVATAPMGDDPTQVNPIEAFADLLEKETGRPVDVLDVPDYLSVVEAIRSDHVDFGIMSGFPSALVVNTGGVDALMAWNGDNKPVSTCLVLNDSPVKSLGAYAVRPQRSPTKPRVLDTSCPSTCSTNPGSTRAPTTRPSSRAVTGTASPPLSRGRYMPMQGDHAHRTRRADVPVRPRTVARRRSEPVYAEPC